MSESVENKKDDIKTKQKISKKVKVLLLVVLTFASIGIFLILNILSQGNFWGDLINKF
jgi:uncharacterized protein (UPF0333 family)